MIEALDETIKALLIGEIGLDLAEVDISFDVPNREWSGAIAKPTINVYLHDIRENVELRSNEWTSERAATGRVTRTKAPPRFDLSYLVTVWTSDVADEHRLLWLVLAALTHNPVLPETYVQGMLRDQRLPIATKVAQPDSVPGNPVDVWTALDNQLKPALPYTVTLALDPFMFQSAPEVRSKLLRFTRTMPTLTPDDTGDVPPIPPIAVPPGTETIQIGGHISAADGAPVRAEVVLVEQGLNTRADKQGRYSFGNIARHSRYTLVVVAPGYATARHEFAIPSPSYDVTLQPEK